MKIAQVAPLYESVPPACYGGTERVVAWLTEELIAAGHDVTLFASCDSTTSARLVPCCERALRLAEIEEDIAPHLLEIERVLDGSERFDLIHFHTGILHLPMARRSLTPSLTTQHGRLDIPQLWPLLREFREHPFVSISDEQRAPVPWARWAGTVHHGMPPDIFSLGDAAGDHHDGGRDYLAFVGRISPEKRPDRAIRIARAAGVPLKIAAKVGDKDRKYYETEIKPLIENGEGGVEFLGEVDDAGKQILLGNALGFLFPIDWPEPFGIAMIEAMACGCPVIATPSGSVPSVVDDGVTGLIVTNLKEAVAAVKRLPKLSRARVRAVFEERFSARRMAQDYIAIYERLLEERAVGEPEWSSV